MPANDFVMSELPVDFEERCRATRQRLESGEPMTVEYIAGQLGLSFECFAAACAVYSATVYGVPMEIDATSRETTH
jgi:hypothetical protein